MTDDKCNASCFCWSVGSQNNRNTFESCPPSSLKIPLCMTRESDGLFDHCTPLTVISGLTMSLAKQPDFWLVATNALVCLLFFKYTVCFNLHDFHSVLSVYYYSGTPPYDHPVYKTTSLLRPYSFKPNVKTIESFYYFEDPVNATNLVITTRILWPNGGRINGVPL